MVLVTISDLYPNITTDGCSSTAF